MADLMNFSPSSPPPAFLSLLPDDVLRCDIFACCSIQELSVLDQAMTSQKHRNLFLNALQSLRYTQFTDITCKEMAQWLASRGVLLQRLSAGADVNLSLVTCHYASATHLDLSACSHYLCRHELFVLATSCHSLSHINLPDGDLTEDIMELLLTHNPALCAVNVSDCSRVTDHMLGLLGRLVPSLSYLDVSYCTAITDDGLALLALPSDESALQDTRDAHADISGRLIPADETRAALPLRQLVLAQCHLITDRGLFLLLPRCTALARLDLGYCRGLTDEGLHEATRQCSQLTHLALTNCFELSESGLYAIATRCPSLLELDVFNCSQLVTDGSVAALASGCPLLQSLNMYNCKQVSDTGLGVLAQHCVHLKQLNISSCVLITDSGLGTLSQHCRQLYSLDLSYCNKITNRGVDELRRNCSLLKSMNVFKCQNVRNLDLMALYTSS